MDGSSVAETNNDDPSRRSRPQRHDRPSADGNSTGAPAGRNRIVAALSWNTIGQFAILGINLLLTPYLLHHLGATPYGIFALVSTTRGLISNLDGGLGPTGYRYFPVHVGRGNVAVTTSFLLTMLTLVGILVGAETIAMMLGAPALASVFALGSSLRDHSYEIAQLLKVLAPLLFLGAIRTPFQRLVMAHHRWAFINYTEIVSTIAFTVVTVALSLKTSGLQCLVWGLYAQEAVIFTTAVWACRRYTTLKGLRWLPFSEVRQILHYGARIQISAVASSFNSEVNALLVGFLFPVSNVAYYSIGVNFSQQVLGLPENALNPISQEIGRNYGSNGKEGVLRSFSDDQRTWVTALGILPMIGALEGWFGISAWLGHGSQIAAATAIMLILGTAPLLFNSIVDVVAKTVGMPEIESWYLGIGVAINVACAIPAMLLIGVLGIPLGTGVGQVISFFVCIYLARKKIGKEITPFIADVRYAPAFIAIVLAGVSEWVFRNSLPTGGIGLVLSGLLTLPAFVTYYGWVYRGPLLQRFGSRADAVQDDRRAQTDERNRNVENEEDDDSIYARRQLRGIQVLTAIAEDSYASRQSRGMLALMAIAEPELMTVVPFSGSTVRFRYTGPVERVRGRPLVPPPQSRSIWS